MTRRDFRLAAALFCSLLLHAAPMLPALLSTPSSGKKPPAPPLTVELAPARPSSPALRLDPPPKADTAATAKATPPKPLPPTKVAAQGPNWVRQVREHLQKLDQQGQFYPRESIALGEQGEVLVLLILNSEGQVVGSRIEQGSGYPRLDEAALRAVRSLRGLSEDAPRETLIPVRFRLK